MYASFTDSGVWQKQPRRLCWITSSRIKSRTNEYHETHRIEIAMYENAEKYLREVMQGHFDPKKLPPVSKWQAEHKEKTADKQRAHGKVNLPQFGRENFLMSGRENFS